MTPDESMQSLGGKARAESLTPEKRSQIAAEAAAARWGIPKAVFGAADRPLQIGGIEIPCYVLDDGRRVLVQRAMVSALGMARGGSSRGGGDRLAHFVAQSRLNDFVSNELREVTNAPLRFLAPNGSTAYGYEAEVLANICFAVIDAERADKLQEQQAHIAEQCRILIKGFAIVGINALVDEATGYQEIRDRMALQKILEKYISKELLKWAKLFPDDFYKEMFRLRGWKWEGMKINRPSVVGHFTNNLVYERLAAGVLDELRRRNPPDEAGHRKHKHHQWLSADIGHPKLRDHLNGVIALMRAAGTWPQFIKMMDRAFPRIGHNLELALADDE